MSECRKIQLCLRPDEATLLHDCLFWLVRRHANRTGGVMDPIDGLALLVSKTAINTLLDGVKAAIAKATSLEPKGTET